MVNHSYDPNIKCTIDLIMLYYQKISYILYLIQYQLTKFCTMRNTNDSDVQSVILHNFTGRYSWKAIGSLNFIQ